MVSRLKKWYNNKVGKPTGATIDGWQEWTDRTKSKHPILYWMFDTVPSFFKTHIRMVTSFKYHFIQKYTHKGYHRLKLDVKRFKEPYGKNNMGKYGWMDADTQLELFSFQILVNFVEKEYGYETLRDTINNGEGDWYLVETLDLYEWFINDYCNSSYEEKLRREIDEKYPNSKHYHRLVLFEQPKNDLERAFKEDYSHMLSLVSKYEDKLQTEMTENLIRLVKIRGVLWT